MLQDAFCNSLIIVAIHACFWPGMIFNCIRKRLTKLPDVIKKPLYDCMICMSSIWGIVYFAFSQPANIPIETYALRLTLHVLIVCGINVVLDSCINYWRRGGNVHADKKDNGGLL